MCFHDETRGAFGKGAFYSILRQMETTLRSETPVHIQSASKPGLSFVLRTSLDVELGVPLCCSGKEVNVSYYAEVIRFRRRSERTSRERQTRL